ncbi:MAG: PCRF domain-containing protein, partial [Bacteroidota bacterium]|nr:PCRF domain-containing protein [Bacteroidota bacterium]
MKVRIEKLASVLSIEKKKRFIEDEELKTQSANFWDDPKSAEKQLKKINKQKIWVSAFDDLQSCFDDFNVMYDFFLEGEIDEAELQISFEDCQKKLADLEFKNMLSKEEDNLPAIVTINPGAGGTESQDWAEMLMRMYIMWGEKNKFKVKELDFQSADI